jgi:hypothetical protein
LYLASDPLADDLVTWIERTGEPAQAQFERSIRHGIAGVPNPEPELQRFFERADELPDWVDFTQIRVGALAYQRFGILGMIVLSSSSAPGR